MGFDTDSLKDRPTLIKVGLAMVAIGIAVSFIGYYVVASRPKVIVTDNSATLFKSDVMNKFAYEQFAGVRMTISEDQTSVLVEGTVKSTEELNKLKEFLEAGQPKVPFDLQVKVK